MFYKFLEMNDSLVVFFISFMKQGGEVYSSLSVPIKIP